MTNQQKLEALKAFLQENGFKYKCDYKSNNGARADLYIGRFRIMVRLSREGDQKFFLKTRYYYHPFFIRDNETKDFVLEKMQNLIIKCMQEEQAGYQRQYDKEHAKRERK